MALPRFTPSTITTAFLRPPLRLAINFCDSRSAVPQTCGSLPILRAGNLGTGPERVIVPATDPPSVTAVTSYPPAAVAAGAGGAGGMSVVGFSLVPRLQLTIIASITPAPYAPHLSFTADP